MKPLCLPALESNQKTAFAFPVISRHHNLYRVQFENGYSNMFFTDVETGHWVEEDLGFTNLAAEIGERIAAQVKLKTGKMLSCTWVPSSDGQPAFGFFKYRKASNNCYDIFHANRRYAYTLVEWAENEWQVTGRQNNLMNREDALRAMEISRVLSAFAEMDS